MRVSQVSKYFSSRSVPRLRHARKIASYTASSQSAPQRSIDQEMRHSRFMQPCTRMENSRSFIVHPRLSSRSICPLDPMNWQKERAA